MAKIWAFISSISVGLLLIAFWGWQLYNAETFVTTNPEIFRNAMIKNILFTTLIFSIDTVQRARTEKGIFSLSIVKGFPKFFASMLVTIIILRTVGIFIVGADYPSILLLLSSGFRAIIIMNVIIVAIPEELAFRGFFAKMFKTKGTSDLTVGIVTSLLFGLYHYSADFGNPITMLVHSVMGLAFFYISRNGIPLLQRIPRFGNQLFGPSPDTQMTNAGVHAGWNLFVIGFIR